MRPVLLHTSPVKNYLIWQKTCRTASNAPWKATWVLMIFSVITSNDKVTDNWLYWIGRLNHNSTATSHHSTTNLVSHHSLNYEGSALSCLSYCTGISPTQNSIRPDKMQLKTNCMTCRQIIFMAGKFKREKKMQLLDRTEVTLTFPSAILHSYPLKFTNLL